MAALTRTLVCFAMMTVLVKLATAATYTVGSSNGGWDSSTDLQTWASSQTFLVGDTLNFQYSPSHNVLEVSKADYDSCLASNSIQAYSGGSTTIPLSSAGKRYFICGTPGHCSQGMKLEVDTSLASTSAPTASPATNLAPQESPSATPLASSLAPDTSSASSPSQTPELAFGPAPSTVTTDIPSTESPTSISRTGSTTDPSSAASSLNNKGGLALGFGIMTMLCFAF